MDRDVGVGTTLEALGHSSPLEKLEGALEHTVPGLLWAGHEVLGPPKKKTWAPNGPCGPDP